MQRVFRFEVEVVGLLEFEPHDRELIVIIAASNPFGVPNIGLEPEGIERRRMEVRHVEGSRSHDVGSKWKGRSPRKLHEVLLREDREAVELEKVLRNVRLLCWKFDTGIEHPGQIGQFEEGECLVVFEQLL